MSEVEKHFHERWLAMVEPIEGLVVSVPVLTDAQAMVRHGPELRERLRGFVIEQQGEHGRQRPLIGSARSFFADFLSYGERLIDEQDLDSALSLYVVEGRETLRPTFALKRRATPRVTRGHYGSSDVAMLVVEVPGLPLDKPDERDGAWRYPLKAKFDRLLRHAGVPVGVLTNGSELCLFYAPRDQSTGILTFRLEHMLAVGGREILDACVMLLSAERQYALAADRQLAALLEESRRRQADVTNELAAQVYQALEILLQGFGLAEQRDGTRGLREAFEHDEVYGGLLTTLLRLVFTLYAEERDLLPTDNELYAGSLSVLGLFDELQNEAGAYPDTMHQRFGAYARLVSLARAIYFGVAAPSDNGQGAFVLPARYGDLFDPERYPFLEGRARSGAAPRRLEEIATIRLPSVDDETIYRVLDKLLFLRGQRLSYRALDVEQIGSVYEALMGYHVVRVVSPSVRLHHVWVSVEEVLAQFDASRGALLEGWLADEVGLAKTKAKKLAATLKDIAKGMSSEGGRTGEDVVAAITTAFLEYAGRDHTVTPPGALVVQPGAERRRTSSHYTPRSLTEPIVRCTLDPLLAAIGKQPTSTQILALKICDPAMGSGAFLVETCRYLANALVLAWTREGAVEKLGNSEEDVFMHALRLVAQRCLYGVDKNPFAVSLAKLSLWLVTLAKHQPFTFSDHALRHGDSLVGLSVEQIRTFAWRSPADDGAKKKGKKKAAAVDGGLASEPKTATTQREWFELAIDRALESALQMRAQILELAREDTVEAAREKELLWLDVNYALERARLVGDVLVGAFFAGKTTKDREEERKRRLVLVSDWLSSGDEVDPPGELVELREQARARTPVFHWELEFPEVFCFGRADPLVGTVKEAGARKGASQVRGACMDGFVGNPPFLGGRRISGNAGDAYSEWLEELHSASKNADLAAHFFRRCFNMLGDSGTLGLIATNTIGQGDTRSVGLKRILADGGEIYSATRSMLWPGDAAVAVSVVHLAKGNARAGIAKRFLDGSDVLVINSRLRAKPERPDPVALRANNGRSYQGSVVVGMGFVVSPDEREALVAKDPRNAERTFPYIGGEEVNTQPEQMFDRYVISFGDLDLADAEKWPDLIGIVREKVKPERDRVNRDTHRKYWWHFGDKRPGLYAAIAPLERCLVTGVISKHLMFSFQPTDRVFSHKLYVFPLDGLAYFALLQSRVHGPWAWLMSSTMKNDMNYSASDCFDTFPFPPSATLTSGSAVETAGRDLYEARATYMTSTQQGLTQTYNKLKDPTCNDPEIERLRALHLAMDRAVLTAYGWQDIVVPLFTTPQTDAEKEAIEAFEDEVIDRLFALNAERAAEEAKLGHPSPSKSPPSKPRKTKAKNVAQGELL